MLHILCTFFFCQLMSGTNVYYYLQTLYTRFTQTQKKLNDTVTNLTIQCNNKFCLNEYINKVETFVNKFDNMIVSVDQINKDITEKVDYIVNNNQIFKDDIDSQLQQFNNDLSRILNELKQNLLDINNELILMNKTLDNKANTEHTHNINNINDLQTSLDSKANTEHTHILSNITDLDISNYATVEQLNTKANVVHSHGDSIYHKTDVVDIIFPIGSIYISINNTDPGTIFGGTWEQIADKTLYAVYGKNDLGLDTSTNMVENDVVQYTTNTSSDVKYVSCYMWYRTE